MLPKFLAQLLHIFLRICYVYIYIAYVVCICYVYIVHNLHMLCVYFVYLLLISYVNVALSERW